MYQGAKRKADDAQPPFDRAQGKQDQPRRDQGFQNAPRPYDNAQGKRDQNRDQRGQNRQQPRVNDADFPAMHMQGPRGSQNQNPTDNRRFNNPQRGGQQAPQRPQQPFDRTQGGQFGQGQSAVDDIRNRIRQQQEEKSAVSNQMPVDDDLDQPIMDAQLVNEPTVAPIEDVAMPEEQNYNEAPTDEIPDDWLMPKVFKSSKNNN
jgi:hypothetical protein